MRFVRLSVWPVGLSWGQDRRRNMGDDMEPLVIRCEGAKWQDDFGALAPRLYNLFHGFFRGHWDRDERAQEAICWTMEDFAAKWEAGACVVLWTKAGLNRACAYRSWVRKTGAPRDVYSRSVKAVACVRETDRVADGTFLIYRDADLLSDAERMSRAHGRAVRLMLAADRKEVPARLMHKRARFIQKLLYEVLVAIRG